MSLRDRIIREIRTPRLVQREPVPLADAHIIADAILSDPEIAAMREVAEKAKSYRSVSVPLMVAGYAAEPCGVEEDKELLAALARLEEARK